MKCLVLGKIFGSFPLTRRTRTAVCSQSPLRRISGWSSTCYWYKSGCKEAVFARSLYTAVPACLKTAPWRIGRRKRGDRGPSRSTNDSRGRVKTVPWMKSCSSAECRLVWRSTCLLPCLESDVTPALPAGAPMQRCLRKPTMQTCMQKLYVTKRVLYNTCRKPQLCLRTCGHLRTSGHQNKPQLIWITHWTARCIV